MSGIDWQTLMFGLAAGAVASTVFFGGLAFGMRLALRRTRTSAILLLSAVLRITLLLGVGWFVARSGNWAFLGYVASFLLVRLIAVSVARPRPISGAKRWN